jgi:ABC-2 type transport system ATP-binding protein
MAVVAVRGLHKSYAGKAAVSDLTFSVESGEILGLIGPNGAGKSTTIKVILDFMKPDCGEVEVFGHQMNESDKDRIGYLPEEKGLYKNLVAIDLILYLAALKGMDRLTAEKVANGLLRRSGMLESGRKKIKELSKGMAQIVQLIVTIIHSPELIILDEPFRGLDPVNAELMKDIIGALRDEGKAIILSTHQMNNVEELCDRVLMINQGQSVLYGGLRETRERFSEHSVQVVVDGELGDLAGVVDRKLDNGSVKLVLARDASPQSILDQLCDRGVTIRRFEITTPSLNDIFLKIAGQTHA